MKDDNLNKLAFWITKHLETMRRDETPGWDISNQSYTSLYINIFMDEINTNGEPARYDAFSDILYSRLSKDDQSDANLGKILETFNSYWSAWGILYDELNKKGKLHHDDN